MALAFTQTQIDEISRLDETVLPAFIEGLSLHQIRANKTAILKAIGRLLHVSEYDLGLIITRQRTKKIKRLYHFSMSGSDASLAFDNIPKQQWNKVVKAHTLDVRTQPEEGAFFDLSKSLYAKTALIKDTPLFHVIKSTPTQKQKPRSCGTDTPYKLHDRVHSVNFGDITHAFTSERPREGLSQIKLCADLPQEYAMLQDGSLDTSPHVLDKLTLLTRHPALLFEITTNTGETRFMLYSVADNRVLKTMHEKDTGCDLIRNQFATASRDTGQNALEADINLIHSLKTLGQIAKHPS